MPRKAKPWKWKAGEFGSTVVAFEREPGGNLYLGVPLTGGGLRKISLGHRDREAAKTAAEDLARKRRLGEAQDSGPLTVSAMFALYLKSVEGKQGKVHSADTLRCSELWTRFLGPTFRVQKFRLSDWERFSRLRATGEIDARGKLVTDPDKRAVVGPRIVAKDLKCFRAACARAALERTGEETFLLPSDPTRGTGFVIPENPNPHQPIVDADRVEALLAVADGVTMRVGWGKEARWVPSYFQTLLILAGDSGRRIGAIVALRASDWKPSQGKNGQILWRADSDKVKRDWLSPVTPEVRAELERVWKERPMVGEAWLFPAPNNSAKPLDEQRAIDWLRKAETLAGLDHIDRGAYHCLRRKWATERKDMSAKDVAEVGGWRDVTTLQRVYQKPDAETMEAVVLHPKRLRKLG